MAGETISEYFLKLALDQNNNLYISQVSSNTEELKTNKGISIGENLIFKDQNDKRIPSLINFLKRSGIQGGG